MHREPLSICNPRHHTFAVCACLGLIVGCTAASPALVATSGATTSPQLNSPDAAMVVRHGRYTLVELIPDESQGDLMQQIVNITFPAAVIHNVADALRYLLLRSGYRLREDCEPAHAFDELPLPTAHAQLGPLTLRSALQVLVGPGWQLDTDEATRTVCFARRDSLQLPDEVIRSRGPEHSND